MDLVLAPEWHCATHGFDGAWANRRCLFVFSEEISFLSFDLIG